MTDSERQATSQHFTLASLQNLLSVEETSLPPVSAAEAALLTDDHVVCWCNNVTAGEIREVLHNGTAHNLAEVQRCTRATGGCGKCLPTVTALVESETAH